MNVDTALRLREDAGQPVCVALIGAGATGRAIAVQLGTPVPGIRIAGIANREGNVVGLMPHPDRCAEGILGSEAGRRWTSCRTFCRAFSAG